MFFTKYPYYHQLDATDCGFACLKMISLYYHKDIDLELLRKEISITKNGISLLGISEGARLLGYKAVGVMLSFEQLTENMPFPCIAHWEQNHFVVIWKIKKRNKEEFVYIADPAKGNVWCRKKDFINKWCSTVNNGEEKGICLLLEATPMFFKKQYNNNKTTLKYLFSSITKYRKYIIQIFFSLLLTSAIQLIFPFLTQAIVDIGINYKNLNFIYLILIAQLVLFLGGQAASIIRSWLLLHVSIRFSLSILSDFILKLTKLPLSFFDGKMTGDIYQRISDHHRIENYFTSESFNLIFSLFNLCIFSIVLYLYSIKIFIVFLGGSVLYTIWLLLFINKRRVIDYMNFSVEAKNQNYIIQLINGMTEIKLSNCEEMKRWEWEYLQGEKYKIQVKSMGISQIQSNGCLFINELKNIFISILAATSVIEGEITLGMMLAIQYIVGQLNTPLIQAVQYIYTLQDAKISLERLSEVQNKEEEDCTANKLKKITHNGNIYIKDLSFQYEGTKSAKIINDINLEIKKGEVTAIVGVSGSGKTTLLKLLLGFYQPSKGEISIGENKLNDYNIHWWRSQCGIVMQDGFIFSDSIAKNIAMCIDYEIDMDRLQKATEIANIQNDIESLPLKYNTKIGQEGMGLSQGQKQRILIARAIYKNPSYILFDEATNSLDTSNEKTITENLNHFFQNKTVIIIAHRLSTIKKANKIVVINKGTISEYGTHKELIKRQGDYYNLVKDQIETINE